MVLITANQMRLYTRKIPLAYSMRSIHPHYLATAEFPMREFTHYVILRKTQFCTAKKEPVKLIKCVTIEISFFHAISQTHMSP